MQYFTTDNSVTIKAQPSIHDSNQGKEKTRAELMVTYHVMSSYSKDLYYSAHFVLFDKNGDIFWLYTGPSSFLIGEYPRVDDGNRSQFITYDNIMYKDYIMPEVLKGTCTGIVALVNIES